MANPGYSDDTQQPTSIEGGAKKSRHGADLLDSVARAKSAAARLDPNIDTSASVAAKVKRERWSTTS